MSATDVRLFIASKNMTVNLSQSLVISTSLLYSTKTIKKSSITTPLLRTREALVRPEEIGILVIILLLWTASVVLFYRRWRKLSHMEPCLPYLASSRNSLVSSGKEVRFAVDKETTRFPDRRLSRKADSNHNSGSGGGEGGGGCPPLGGSTSSRGVSIDIDMTLMEQTTNHTTTTTTTTTEFTTIQQNGGGKHVTLIQNGAKHKDDIINSCPVQNGGKRKDDIINGSIVQNGDNGHVTKQVSLPEAGPSRPTTLDLNTRRKSSPLPAFFDIEQIPQYSKKRRQSIPHCQSSVQKLYSQLVTKSSGCWSLGSSSWRSQFPARMAVNIKPVRNGSLHKAGSIIRAKTDSTEHHSKTIEKESEVYI